MWFSKFSSQFLSGIEPHVDADTFSTNDVKLGQNYGSDLTSKSMHACTATRHSKETYRANLQYQNLQVRKRQQCQEASSQAKPQAGRQEGTKLSFACGVVR